MTRFGRELLESAQEALDIAKGDATPVRTFAPEPPDVAAIRKKLGLSQDKFAAKFHIPVATIRDWEQRRRQPDVAARNLLRVIEFAPGIVEQALS